MQTFTHKWASYGNKSKINLKVSVKLPLCPSYRSSSGQRQNTHRHWTRGAERLDLNCNVFSAHPISQMLVQALTRNEVKKERTIPRHQKPASQAVCIWNVPWRGFVCGSVRSPPKARRGARPARLGRAAQTAAGGQPRSPAPATAGAASRAGKQSGHPTSQLRGSGWRADSPRFGAAQPREGPQQSRVREGTGSGPWGTNSSLFKQQTQTKTHRHTPKPPVTPLSIPSQETRGLRSLTGATRVKREGRN